MVYPLSRHALIYLLLLCCGSVPDIRGQAGERKEAPATISGRVEQDGGGGLRGIVVALLESDPASRLKVAAKTATGADGRYVLSDVPPGRYWLWPQAAAYVIAGSTGDYPPGRQVFVAAGESVEDLDITLIRGGVITGRVTNADGKPLIRETVELSSVGPSRAENTGPLRQYRSATDDRGIYRIYGLPAGSYRVSAGRGLGGDIRVAPNGSYRRVYYPGTTLEAEAKVVEVSPGGEATDVDIKLGKPAKTFRASGRVIAESGEFVPGVSLYLVASGRGEEGPARALAAQSDARGEFRLKALTPGRYAVFASPDGAADWYSEEVPFEIEGSDVSGLEIRIRRGVSLFGVVLIEGTRDRDKLSRLISQITLNVWHDQRGGPAATIYQRPVRPSPDGSFRIDGLRPGRVRLLTGWPPVKGLTLLRVEHDGADRSDGLEISEGAAVTGVRVVFAYGNATVRGQVKVAEGVLPPQSRIVAYVLRPGGTGHFIGRPADVDARGRFSVEGLPAGDYELVVQARRPGMSPLEVRQHVTVPEDGETEVSLTLGPGGTSN